MLDHEETLYTVQMLADHFYTSRGTIYRLIKDGSLPAIRPGRSWLIPKDSLDTFIRERTEKIMP